jgi:hypothetical protein
MKGKALPLPLPAVCGQKDLPERYLPPRWKTEARWQCLTTTAPGAEPGAVVVR